MIFNIIKGPLFVLYLIFAISIGNKDQFQKFQNSFRNINMPLKLDSVYLTNENSKKELDTNLTRKYLVRDGKHYIFKIYRFYPIGKFAINNNQIALLYKKEGGAGGFQDYYFLATFTINGNIISSKLVAKRVGDCGSIRYRWAKIKKNFDIYITDRSYRGSCSDKEGELTKHKETQLLITDNGYIKKK